MIHIVRFLVFFYLSFNIAWAAVELTVQKKSNNDEIIYSQSDQSNITTRQKIIIKIAVILPLTGKSAESGKSLQQALPLIEYLNETEKYNRTFAESYEFQTILYDDGCDDAMAKQVAEAIVARKDIHFVIGHYCSSTTDVGAKIYANQGILQISPFSTLSNLTEKGYRHFFRLAGRNDVQAEEAGTQMMRFAQGRNIGVIWGKEKYGRDLATRIRNVLRRGNTDIALELDILRGETDIPTLADRLLKKNIGVAYFGGYYNDLVELLRELDKRQKKIIFFTADSAQNRDFWNKAGPLASNVLFTLTKDYTRDISEREKNAIARLIAPSDKERVRGTNEAFSSLGGSFAVKNRAFNTRTRFIRQHFQKYGFFPDLYALHLYATYQIIQNIALDINAQAGLPNTKTLDEQGNISTYNRYIDANEWADVIGSYMRNQGFNAYSDYVGFETVLGGVNFDEAGDWTGANYYIYRWINIQEQRPWLALKEDQKDNFKGRIGDFIRVF